MGRVRVSARWLRLSFRVRLRNGQPRPLQAFRRGYERWDIDALLAQYADEVELIQLDRDNPPSAPRVRHGKEMFKGMFEHCAAAGVKATVENALTETERRRYRHLRVPGLPQGRRQRDL